MSDLAAPPERTADGRRVAVSGLPRPLVGVAISLAAGILAGRWGGVAVPAALAAGAIAVAASFAFRRRTTASTLAVQLAVACAGAASVALADAGAMARDIRGILDRDRSAVELAGWVASDPEYHAGDRGGAWHFEAEVEGWLARAGRWERRAGRIAVRWDGEPDRRPAGYGARWRAAGLLLAPRPGFAPLLIVPERGGSILPGRRGDALTRLCHGLRGACAAALARGIERDEETVSFLRTMFLNYHATMPPRVEDAFARTGTLHVVAISGSHVVILGAILTRFLGAAGVPRTRWLWALAPLLGAYTVATGLAPSAVRACIMALAFWSGTGFHRRPDSASATALAALLILAAAPGQLFDTGFILSFGVVIGLIGLYPPLETAFTAFLEPRGWEAAEPPWWMERLRRGARYAGRLLAATVAAWVVSTPLGLHFFHVVSPVALVANLLVVPLSAVILFTGGLALAGNLVSPFLAECFNHANRLLVHGLLRIVEGFASWPGAFFHVESPGVPAVAAMLAGLVLWQLGGAGVRRLVAVGAVAAAGWTAGVLLAPDRWRVVLRPAAGAMTMLVDLPAGGGDVLVNPGSAREAARTIRFLRARGVNRLAVLASTRADADHLGAAVEVLRAYPVEALWLPEGPLRSPAVRALAAAAAAAGIPVERRGGSGETGAWRGGVGWRSDAEGPGFRLEVRGGALGLRLSAGAAGGEAGSGVSVVDAGRRDPSPPAIPADRVREIRPVRGSGVAGRLLRE